MKKQIKLSRIHCAGCAENLEQKICEVEGVNSVSIDFIKKLVTLDVEGKRAEEIVDNVEKCITNFDRSIKIIDQSEQEKQERKERVYKILDIARIPICIVFGIVAILIPENIFWLKITFFVLSYLSVGYEVVYSAIKNLFKGKMLDENFLMLIATIGAFVLQDFIEAIAVMLFYSIGETFESYAVEKSKRRIKSLLEIKSDYVNMFDGINESLVPVENVKVGDLIRIKAGERVPLDCIVVEGSTSLSTAAITGESKELYASRGTELLSGYINGEGPVLCKVLKTVKDSTVTKIIELVEKATKNKAKTEKFITKFANWYTPIVVGLALLLTIIPTICGGDFSSWLYRSLVFLVVSCPCALVLSVPLGYFAGVGASARKGVLVKGTNYIELLGKTNVVIFDKTGTLTYGDFEVEEIFATDKSSKNEVLEIIAYAESFSNHRIAKSILKLYNKPINTAWVQDYTEIAGAGVSVELFNEPCLIGNEKLLKDNNILFEESKSVGTIVYLAKSGEYLGHLVISDKIKEESFVVVDKLKDVGVNHISMLTGDNEGVAKKVASLLKLDSYYSGLLPEEKVHKMSELKAENNCVTFVGDGINDAPVLASVDVGVSMGGVGSDAAIEASDVVLMTDQPTKLVEAIKIAKKTKRLVLQNIIFTLLVKSVVLVLSALGLTGMWLAIFADVGVALLAVLNSLRAMLPIRDKQKKEKR